MKRLAALCLLWSLPALAQEPPVALPAYVLQAARALAPPQPELQRGRARPDPRLSPALANRLGESSGALVDEPLALRLAARRITPGLLASVARLGGTVEAQAVGVLYLRLAANRVAALAQARREIQQIDLQAPLAAQGLPAAPDRLVTVGQGGRGVRVGILDFGFAGYAAAGLPAPRAQRAFGGGEVQAGSRHGTDCARTVHALAPQAELLLARIGDGEQAGEGQALAALQWLAAQGAQLINISASSYGGAQDGSAPLDRLIGELARRGVTVIVAAGNHAQLHWRGPVADANRNGWVDVAAAQGDLLVFELTRGGPVSLSVRWTPGADLDAFVYAVDASGHSRLVAQADTPQDAVAQPVERLTRVLDAGFYLVGLRATRAAPGSVHVVVDGAARLVPSVAAGSVGSPGTAPAAITVGAGSAVGSAAFSGRGPTDDGRAKPELLAAPLDEGFRGSSAAAPVVTGLAARLQASGLRGERLRTALRQAARPVADGSAAWGVMAGAEGEKP